MSVGNKVRIYELAKELKQDTKVVMEQLRREGADVSVPSNSVSKELAEKIRNRYFPKQDVKTAPRTIKVIKKTATTAEDIAAEAEAPVIEARPQVEEVREEKVITTTAAAPARTEQKPTEAKRVIVLRKSPVVAAAPVEEPPVVEQSPVQEEIVPMAEDVPATVAQAPTIEESAPAPEAVVEPPPVEPVQTPQPPPVATAPKVFNPTGIQARKLTLTPAALKSGLKQGERIVAPPPVAPKTERPQPGRGNEQRAGGIGANNRRDMRGGGNDRGSGIGSPGGGSSPFRGTPGESAKPQTIYIPPANSGKKTRTHAE